MSVVFRPDWRARFVSDITPQWLRAHGLCTLLLDADCTLKRYRQMEPEPGVSGWIGQLRQQGVQMCIVSNGLGPRLQAFADHLTLPVIFRAMKPHPRGIRRAMETLGATPERTAMVGDQIFADIAAGRRAGEGQPHHSGAGRPGRRGSRALPPARGAGAPSGRAV
ncbi:MAG: HAD-IA family hydrolase, partial [Planctomycetia bacterium]|nr:HAD-IA family hydrolase [Planctomycetia bacterium]